MKKRRRSHTHTAGQPSHSSRDVSLQGYTELLELRSTTAYVEQSEWRRWLIDVEQLAAEELLREAIMAIRQRPRHVISKWQRRWQAVRASIQICADLVEQKLLGFVITDQVVKLQNCEPAAGAGLRCDLYPHQRCAPQVQPLTFRSQPRHQLSHCVLISVKERSEERRVGKE